MTRDCDSPPAPNAPDEPDDVLGALDPNEYLSMGSRARLVAQYNAVCELLREWEENATALWNDPDAALTERQEGMIDATEQIVLQCRLAIQRVRDGGAA